MEKSKQLKYMLLGALFWFVAALIIRYTGEFFFSSNLLIIILFILLFPLSYVFILIANPEPSETLESVAIMVYTASFLDGLALTFFRQLYGETLEICLLGAASILFGIGVVLLLGHILNVDKSVKEKKHSNK